MSINYSMALADFVPTGGEGCSQDPALNGGMPLYTSAVQYTLSCTSLGARALLAVWQLVPVVLIAPRPEIGYSAVLRENGEDRRMLVNSYSVVLRMGVLLTGSTDQALRTYVPLLLVVVPLQSYV